MDKRLLLLACSSLSALDTEPWMGDAYSLIFSSDLAYERFSHVQGASVQPRTPVNNWDLTSDLTALPTSNIDVQIETDLGHVDSIWGFRSGALQVRYWWLNDIAGEAPVSVTFGVNARGVTGRFLENVSTPYASEFNAELSCSIGKEWAQKEAWKTHLYALLAVGQGNRGSPWTRLLLSWQYAIGTMHDISLFSEGNVGWGGRQHVDASHFRGWGAYQHRSIDLGGGYGISFGVYGRLAAELSYRLFAHNFPEHLVSATLSYSIPFSVL